MKDSKNLVIGMLCAVVCIMAVAYAAFSTTLTINGTASISSTWDVQMTSATCPTKVPATGGAADSVKATASEDTDNVATVNMEFTQPGDYAECEIVYTNNGTLDATLTHVVTGVDGKTVTGTTTENANIRFTITGANGTQTLTKKGGAQNTHTVKVKGEFIESDNQSDATAKSASIKIVSTAKQAGV